MKLSTSSPPAVGKPAFSIDFFIMSLWKDNAFTVWKALTSLGSARPLTTFVIPWKPYCTETPALIMLLIWTTSMSAKALFCKVKKCHIGLRMLSCHM